MAKKLTQDQLSKLINYLDGTCKTLEEALEKLFDLEYEDLQDGDFAELVARNVMHGRDRKR